MLVDTPKMPTGDAAISVQYSSLYRLFQWLHRGCLYRQSVLLASGPGTGSGEAIGFRTMVRRVLGTELAQNTWQRQVAHVKQLQQLANWSVHLMAGETLGKYFIASTTQSGMDMDDAHIWTGAERTLSIPTAWAKSLYLSTLRPASGLENLRDIRNILTLTMR